MKRDRPSSQGFLCHFGSVLGDSPIGPGLISTTSRSTEVTNGAALLKVLFAYLHNPNLLSSGAPSRYAVSRTGIRCPIVLREQLVMQSTCGVGYDAGQSSSGSTSRKRLRRRSHGENSTPRKVCCHVGMDPNRPAQIRETQISTVTLRSLLDQSSTQCHVVCGRGWSSVLCLDKTSSSALETPHADIPPTVLYPRTTNSYFL